MRTRRARPTAVPPASRSRSRRRPAFGQALGVARRGPDGRRPGPEPRPPRLRPRQPRRRQAWLRDAPERRLRHRDGRPDLRDARLRLERGAGRRAIYQELMSSVNTSTTPPRSSGSTTSGQAHGHGSGSRIAVSAVHRLQGLVRPQQQQITDIQVQALALGQTTDIAGVTMAGMGARRNWRSVSPSRFRTTAPSTRLRDLPDEDLGAEPRPCRRGLARPRELRAQVALVAERDRGARDRLLPLLVRLEAKELYAVVAAA